MSALTERAVAMRRQADSLITSPGAYMLPADARKLIRELAAVVHLLAVEVEKCVPGIPSK